MANEDCFSPQEPSFAKDRKDAYNNYTFNLKGGNGEIIGKGENYTTDTNRENGIAAVKRNAPNAPTEDLA